MVHGDPNYETFRVPVCEIEDSYKPHDGWPQDSHAHHESQDMWSETYVDVANLEHCKIPVEIPHGIYGVNGLGWIISRKGSVDEDTGEKRWRRLSGLCRTLVHCLI